MLSDSYLYRVSSYLIDVRLDRGDQYVLVHDNNLYTEVNVKHRWDDVDFLFSFEISEPW